MKKFLSSITNQIMIAMLLGMAVGYIVGPDIGSIKVVGDIFLRLIQMSIVVLIMGAVIEAVGQLEPDKLTKLGGKVFFLFMITTVFTALVGLILGNILQPGVGLDIKIPGSSAIKPSTATLNQVLLGFFPSNIIKALTDGEMIQIIVFSLLFGLSLSLIGKHRGSNPFLDTVRQFNEVILQVVKLVMKTAPIGIFALLAWVTGTIGIKVIIPLAKFLAIMGVATVACLVLYIAISAAYCKVSPIKMTSKMMNMTVVAFTTTSSAVTLPTEMEDMERKLGISKNITNLVAPLAMALNSNGLSLYLSLACVTLAQLFGMDLSFGQQIQIVVLSTLACLGTVVVPGGGLVALATVLPTMGLPLESVAILAGVDWFSGMFRTVLNVDVDAIIAMWVAKDEKEFDREIFDGTKSFEDSAA